MFERDGIVYAGSEAVEKEVIYAEYLGAYMLRVALNTDEVVDLDSTKDFEGSAFQPLKNEEVLRGFDYSMGFLSWLDGEIDVAPEYLLSVGKMIEGPVVA